MFSYFYKDKSISANTWLISANKLDSKGLLHIPCIAYSIALTVVFPLSEVLLCGITIHCKRCWRLPWWFRGKESCSAGDTGSIPRSGGPLGGGNGNPTPVFLPGKFRGQRNLVGSSPWRCRVRHDWVAEHTCIRDINQDLSWIIIIGIILVLPFKLQKPSEKIFSLFTVPFFRRSSFNLIYLVT